jgi:hypothetical protein
VITPDKIEAWIKEVEERPASAPLILQYIANRLRDLSNRNEELLSENIALMTGKRVEEYERRITHLEYQLDLLKRQVGGEGAFGDLLTASAQLSAGPTAESASLLAYDISGRVLRLGVNPAKPPPDAHLGHLRGEFSTQTEPPRLLALPSLEELLFIFTSGRVATLPVMNIPAAEGEALDWGGASIPDEPRAGETLACLAPVSKMALADCFLQVSRRGFVKKIRSSLAQSILANHYIGSGVNQPADKTFELALCGSQDRLVLVSAEGFLVCLEAGQLPYNIEEVLRLGTTDHLVSAFILPPGGSILVMTQVGKAIYRTADGLEAVSSFRTKGQAVLSAQRRQQGVRVISATAVSEIGWGVALHQDGAFTMHTISDLLGKGVIPTTSHLLAFAVYSPPST